MVKIKTKLLSIRLRYLWVIIVKLINGKDLEAHSQIARDVIVIDVHLEGIFA